MQRQNLREGKEDEEKDKLIIDQLEAREIKKAIIIFKSPLRIQEKGKEQRRLTKSLFLTACLTWTKASNPSN